MSNYNRFEEIQEEIHSLANEAIDLLPDREKDRAKAYWFAHICGALGGNYNHYLGGSFVSMEDSKNAIEDDDYDYYEEDEEDEDLD